MFTGSLKSSKPHVLEERYNPRRGNHVTKHMQPVSVVFICYWKFGSELDWPSQHRKIHSRDNIVEKIELLELASHLGPLLIPGTTAKLRS